MVLPLDPVGGLCPQTVVIGSLSMLAMCPQILALDPLVGKCTVCPCLEASYNFYKLVTRHS